MSNPYPGNVGAFAGLCAPLSVTPQVSIASYLTGKCVGGLLTFANAMAQDGGSAFLHHVMFITRNSQTPSGYLFFWDQNPTTVAGGSANVNDNATLAMGTSDMNVITVLTVAAADYVISGTSGFAALPNLGRIVKATSGKDLYAAFVLNGGSLPTFTASTQFKIRAKFVPNIN